MLRLSPVQHKSAGLRSCCADDAVAVSSSGCFRCRGPLRPVDIGDDGHGLQRERLCAAGWDRAHPSFSAEKLERSLTRSVTSVGRAPGESNAPAPAPSCSNQRSALCRRGGSSSARMLPNARKPCATMCAGKRSMYRTLTDAVHSRAEGGGCFRPPQTYLVPYGPTLLACCVELHRRLNPIKS